MPINNEETPTSGRMVIGRDMPLDVCICTHDPRPDIFRLVLMSLAHQTAEKGSFRVVIIDNASTPPLTADDYAVLTDAGIEAALVREPTLGNVFSRARAYQATKSDWILFVDDDNELSPDYIATGLEIIRNRPELGCFGGKLELPEGLVVPHWMKSLLPFLAIRDYGDKEITNIADHWGEWEPVTAGGFINRAILGLYAKRIFNDPATHVLGRKGKNTLNSCEDSLMMAGAFPLGLACSYQPSLRLNHHVRVERFQLSYLLHLMSGFGKSEIMLEYLCGRSGQWGKQSCISALGKIVNGFRKERMVFSWQYALCMMVRRVSLFRQKKRIVGGTV